MLKIGFIGVGNMGQPMAYNLLQQGFDVTVYDADKTRAKALLPDGAKLAGSLEELVSPGCFIITMVPDDAALLSVVEGESGLLALLTKNETHINMSTVSPDVIETISKQYQQKGVGFLSAPVLGRPIAAKQQALWLFLSGDTALKSSAKPIFTALGQSCYDFGEDIMAASKIKLAVNFLILSAIESMGEAIHVVDQLGLDASVFVAMITETLFSCLGYQYHASNIQKKQFEPAGFALKLGLKDINLFLDQAAQVNYDCPFAEILQQRLIQGMKQGQGHLDWAAITWEKHEDTVKSN